MLFFNTDVSRPVYEFFKQIFNNMIHNTDVFQIITNSTDGESLEYNSVMVNRTNDTLPQTFWDNDVRNPFLFNGSTPVLVH
jgi:hypothetical protein